MAFLYSQRTRKILLTLILGWGLFTFYLQNPDNWNLLLPIFIIGSIGLVVIWKEISAIFTLILLSFTSSYSLYAVLYQLSLPLWFIMLGILVIFGYLFTYNEQRIGILGDKRLIYLVLFSLVILEAFMTLSYFLIDPISQSLIISAICYLFVGFCYTILAKHTDNKFITYITFTVVSIVLVLLTTTWGGLV